MLLKRLLACAASSPPGQSLLSVHYRVSHCRWGGVGTGGSILCHCSHSQENSFTRLLTDAGGTAYKHLASVNAVENGEFRVFITHFQIFPSGSIPALTPQYWEGWINGRVGMRGHYAFLSGSPQWFR